jgi:alcohol dehydrogenase class IV
MPPWTFHSAGSLVFGRGAVDQLGDIAKRLKAGRVLVITDTVLRKTGILDRIHEPLTKAGLIVETFDGCLPEPPIEVIRSATEAAKSFRPDLLVGLGGGSNMDAAKLVSVVLTHGRDATDYVGDCRVPGPVFPLVCVPTTAGTGSEVSAAAVFTDTAKKMKVSTLSPYLRPAVALVDPSLTDTCPPKVTADSGIDALTHAIEAYTAVDHGEFLKRPPGGETVYQGRNTMSDYMAAECIQLCGRFLKRAVKDGTDTEARNGMALAGTLGGMAFSNAGVALVHAMEYPVGGAVHVSHGAGNGLLLPYVMRFNMTERADEIGNVGLWLCEPGEIPGAMDEWAEGAIAKVEQLRKDIGIPLRLRDIGVTEEMLPGFAERAFGIKRLMRTNPRVPQSAGEIEAIYRAAY